MKDLDKAIIILGIVGLFLSERMGQMPTIEMVRIDNRLIHGQVSTRWCTQLDINTIIVVNDSVAANKIQQGLFDMSIPDTFDSRYYSISKAINKIPTMSSEKKILIVVECIDDLRQLVEAGLTIPYVNIGNLDMSAGKRHISPTTCMNQTELDWITALAQSGTKVEIRRIPSEDAIKIF